MRVGLQLLAVLLCHQLFLCTPIQAARISKRVPGRMLLDPEAVRTSRAAARAARKATHIVPSLQNVTLKHMHQGILEDDAPRPSSLETAALPQGCISYNDRFSKYKAPRADGWNPNEEIPHANMAVVMRVHHGMSWSEDLRLTVSALMTECRDAGLHFWLLHQDTTVGRAEASANPTTYILDTPREFRPILQTFTALEVHNEYPLVHVYNEPLSREYLPVSLFFQLSPGYKFAWVVENDVRYTGADWGVLLNTLLNTAAHSLGGRDVAEFHPDLAALPNDSVKLPDLILIGRELVPAEVPMTDQFLPRDVSNWRLRNFRGTFTNLLGMSRLYLDTLHEHSVDGNGGFIEDFVLSLALDEKLDIATVTFPEWGGNSIHCCTRWGTDYYEDWYLSGQCRYFGLVHPVKNDNQTIWGTPASDF